MNVNLGSQVKASRPHLDLYLNFPSTFFRSLYDTGSAVSLVSSSTFQKALRAHKVGPEIKDHGLSLTTAAGQPLPIDGVFPILVRILDKEVRIPFVVCPVLACAAIIGMSTIEEEGLMYDPRARSFSFSSAPKPDSSWTQAALVSTEVASITPHRMTTVRCRLRREDGRFVGGNTSFIADVGDSSIMARTNNNGVAEILLPISTDSSSSLPRGSVLGLAEPTSSFLIQELSADVVAAISQPLPPQPLTKQHIELIDKAALSAPPSVRPALSALLRRFPEVISTDEFDMGRSTTLSHEIHMQHQVPIYTRQYPLAQTELEFLRASVRGWLQHGIIERARSLWNNAIFAVSKPHGGGLRAVVDMRKINSASLDDKFSIPLAHDILREVGYAQATTFSSLDLRNSYFQMNLHESSRKYTAFTLEGTQYQWVSSPQGLKGCSSSFSRLIHAVLEGVSNQVSFIDDILVFCRRPQDHLHHLEQVLLRLRQHGLKLNLAKCTFHVPEATFVGHVLSKDGIRPGDEKIAALRDAPPPANVKQLQSWIGLANWFRGFHPSFARDATALYRLTRKDSPWSGGALPPEAFAAYEKIKTSLTSKPILSFPVHDGKYFLFTDGATGSSDPSSPDEGGLGAALLQERPDGSRHLLGYNSRRLRQHERGYGAFLVELQAAVFGIESFEVYLRGRPFTICCDHKPLEKMGVTATRTLNRLQDKMNEFPCHIQYIKGKDNAVADFLSRCSAKVANIGDGSTSADLAKLQDADPLISRWKAALLDKTGDLPLSMKDNLHRLALKDGVVCFKTSLRRGIVNHQHYKIIAPESIRSKLIQDAHSGLIAGHGGFFRTSERIKEFWWWPGLDDDVSTAVRNCLICRKVSNKGAHPPSPLQPLPPPPGPNFRIHVDLWGPIADDTGHNCYIMVTACAFSRILRLSCIKSKSASDVARALADDWIFLYGCPKVIVSDQGREWANDLFKHICQELSIRHTPTSGHWPQCNGLAERHMSELGHYLRAMIAQAQRSNLDWKLLLAPLMFSLNTSVNASSQTSAFWTLFGYNPRALHWPETDILEEDAPLPAGADPVARLRLSQQIMRQASHQNSQHAREQYKRFYDRRNNVSWPTFQPGDLVLVRIFANNLKNKKLAPRWEEAVVVQQTSPATYRINIPSRSRKKQVIVNASHLKYRLPPPRDGVPITRGQPTPPSPAPAVPAPPLPASDEDDEDDEEDQDDPFHGFSDQDSSSDNDDPPFHGFPDQDELPRPRLDDADEDDKDISFLDVAAVKRHLSLLEAILTGELKDKDGNPYMFLGAAAAASGPPSASAAPAPAPPGPAAPTSNHPAGPGKQLRHNLRALAKRLTPKKRSALSLSRQQQQKLVSSALAAISTLIGHLTD